MHLVLEVLAYAADEAESAGNGSCAVILNEDGSISVTDNGRGTDTRTDEHGRAIKKPVMTTTAVATASGDSATSTVSR